MKNQIKALQMLDGKKRYFALAVIAVELASLPAAAQIVHRVAFEVKPRVVAVEIPTAEAGLSRFLVTSNDGFGIEAVDLVGNVRIGVHKSGTISGGQRFGDAAQLPGESFLCAESNSAIGSPIYAAERKTASEPGEVVDQAVVFEFRYDEAASPSFNFKPGTETALPPKLCADFVG